jgi:hypothetical protein
MSLNNFLLAISCLLMVGMLLIGIGSRRTTDRERYKSPRVTRAIVYPNYCMGELIVESSHSEHVLREMDLPYGSVVTINKRNQEYTVRFPLPEKRTPPRWKATVFDERGKKHDATVSYSTEQYHHDRVKAAAEQLGYTGRVEVH